MPPVSLGKGGQRKADKDGKMKGVGLFDGVFEGVVELRALGLLHPIENMLSPRRRAGVHAVDARFVNHAPPLYTFRTTGSNRNPASGSISRGSMFFHTVENYFPWCGKNAKICL